MNTERKKPRYMLVWSALALLTAIEVATAFFVRSAMAGFDISEQVVTTATILILLGLAGWKALLVAMYFMHLKWETRALKWLAVAPLLPAAIFVSLALVERF